MVRRQVKGLWFRFRDNVVTQFLFTTTNRIKIGTILVYEDGFITVRAEDEKIFNRFCEIDSGEDDRLRKT